MSLVLVFFRLAEIYQYSRYWYRFLLRYGVFMSYLCLCVPVSAL